jgi:aspartyl/asparaginyl beta-hydroxylase (cupin superfamily)
MFNAIPDAPEDVIDDCEVIPYRAWKELPIRPLVLELMRLVDGIRLGRVIISRLAPGKSIPEHVDQGAPATYYRRYHLALQSEPGAVNHSADESVVYRMGELWWFDNASPHSVVNNSADDRIVLVMDVRPC